MTLNSASLEPGARCWVLLGGAAWSGAGLGVPAALGQHQEILALALPPPAQRRYGNGEKQPSAWKRPCCARNRGENGSKGEFGGARGAGKQPWPCCGWVDSYHEPQWCWGPLLKQQHRPRAAPARSQLSSLEGWLSVPPPWYFQPVPRSG